MNCEKCKSGTVINISVYNFLDISECGSCGYRISKPIQTCCRTPFDVITYWQKTNGIYRQCMNCGGCKHISKALPHAEFDNQIRSDFNENRYHEWKVAVQSEKSDFYETSRKISKSSFLTLYNNHLKSERWREIRKEVLDRDKHTCQKCNSEKATDVHHLSYKNLGNEPLDDLISYCRDCHENVHGKSF
jgi:Zn ribbon nucleic-acid-binding protein